jgi:hypothetical protein
LTTPAPNRLTDILDGLQARLEGELRGNRAAVTHPGARGEAAEEDWLGVLNGHLPRRYQAARAFVIDSRGDCSEQIDIVIYDRQYSPLLYNQANQRYIPAESVYAVFEVKQKLSPAHVVYAGKKAASVRRLHRTSATISYAEGTYKARTLPRIVAGILAYESSWTPPFGQKLRNGLAKLPPDHQLDIGCALLHGVFEARYPDQGSVDLAVVTGRRSLVQFLMRLMKQLQPLATVPAIDYAAYLERFQREEGVPAKDGQSDE